MSLATVPDLAQEAEFSLKPLICFGSLENTASPPGRRLDLDDLQPLHLVQQVVAQVLIVRWATTDPAEPVRTADELCIRASVCSNARARATLFRPHVPSGH
jgi:hypothetical protein